jgi:hypothetical protein
MLKDPRDVVAVYRHGKSRVYWTLPRERLSLWERLVDESDVSVCCTDERQLTPAGPRIW